MALIQARQSNMLTFYLFILVTSLRMLSFRVARCCIRARFTLLRRSAALSKTHRYAHGIEMLWLSAAYEVGRCLFCAYVEFQLVRTMACIDLGVFLGTARFCVQEI